MKENTKRRSILIVGNFFSTSRASRQVCQEVAFRLSQMDWMVITTSSIYNKLFRLLDMCRTVLIRRNEYRIAQIDLFSGPAFLWAEIVCGLLRRLHKPYVLTMHGGSLPDFAQRWPKRVSRLLCSANAVTSPSNFLVEKMKTFRRDITLLPNSIDIRSYPFRPRKACSPLLVWLRAFHDIYNPRMAPQVIKLLVDKFPDIKIIMVGPDKGDGSLQQTKRLAEKLGVAERFHFPGGIAKEDVSLWLNKGDIFINTTNVDNTPVSVIEAMACGLPVVTTNVGGIPYLLKDGYDALLVPPDVPEAMALAVQRVLLDSSLSLMLSNNARTTAEKMDCRSVFAKWDKLLNDILLSSEKQV